MSPENQGVFQLLKEVTFWRILKFCNSRKWGHFGEILHGSLRRKVGRIGRKVTVDEAIYLHFLLSDKITLKCKSLTVQGEFCKVIDLVRRKLC
jgi:hypothetical protein